MGFASVGSAAAPNIRASNPAPPWLASPLRREEGGLWSGLQQSTGEVLPDMPAYLDHHGYVPVPLEATYQAAWTTCPADLRQFVETGKLPGENAGS